MNFFQKFRDFVSRPTNSRTLVMIVLVAAVSLTVVVSQQQQTTKQRASFVEDGSDLGPTVPTPTPPPQCDSLNGGQHLTCNALGDINKGCTNPDLPTMCLTTKWFFGSDNFLGENVVCCDAALPPTATPTPTPTAVPTPTTAPKLFPCYGTLAGDYKGEYTCAIKYPEPKPQCVDGFNNGYKQFSFLDPKPGNPTYTGLDCGFGNRRDVDNKDTHVCCIAPAAASATCIKKADLDSLAKRYIQGDPDVAVTLQAVNALARKYKLNPCP